MRDYLYANYKKAKEYSELKGALAQKFPYDRTSYTNGKSQLIESILQEANRRHNNTMFLPMVRVLSINPAENVQFICDYLSDEKQKNRTRPFYEKTISLYPELKDIMNVKDETRRFDIIKQSVEKRLSENEIEIQRRIDYFRQNLTPLFTNS